MVGAMCGECCPAQRKAGRLPVSNPTLAVWVAHIEGTALSDKRLTCMGKTNTTLQLPKLFLTHPNCLNLDSCVVGVWWVCGEDQHHIATA